METTAAIPENRPWVSTGPRGFAELHRDVWRLVWRHPIATLVLPALLLLPADWLVESVSALQKTETARLSMSIRMGRLVNLLLGSLVWGYAVELARQLGKSGRIDVREAVAGTMRIAGGLIGTTWSVGWRVTLRLFLLVIPGVRFWSGSALAPVVAVFEDRFGQDAIERSQQLTEGHRPRILGYAFASLGIYFVMAMVPALFAEPETPWASALSQIPINVVMLLWALGTALLYLDIAGVSAQAPAGTVEPASMVRRIPSGRLGVAVAVGLMLTSSSAWVASVMIEEDPPTQATTMAQLTAEESVTPEDRPALEAPIAPPTRAEVVAEMTADINVRVDTGFAGRADILEGVEDLYSEELEAFPDLQPGLSALVTQSIERHRADEKAYPRDTDVDRLDRAFRKLEKQGVVARQDFSDCMTCGSAEIQDECSTAKALGYTFFHNQDTERVVEDGVLMLAYGACPADDNKGLEIGRRVRKALEAEQLNVTWDGTMESRIQVTMLWQKRRSIALDL